MTVTIKGSDWFPESTVGNIILYISKHKQESMLIETEGFFINFCRWKCCNCQLKYLVKSNIILKKDTSDRRVQMQ